MGVDKGEGEDPHPLLLQGQALTLTLALSHEGRGEIAGEGLALVLSGPQT